MQPAPQTNADNARPNGDGLALKSGKAKVSGPTSGPKLKPFCAMVKVPDPSGEITRLLQAAQRGHSVENELLPLVYEQMRRLARVFMGGQNSGHTMQPTDLVHEAYLKLVNGADPTWQNRKHFMAVAGRAMRSILVDHARAKDRIKRKAGDKRVPLVDEWLKSYEVRSIDLIALDEAMEKLAAQDPRMVQIVELRFFSGFSVKEISDILGVSKRTVERDWKVARSLLKQLVQ